jgi:large subunit ribosomal protein L4
MPRKMRHAALRSALSAKAAEAGILVVEDLILADGKTSSMAKVLDLLVGDASALIVIPEKGDSYDFIIKSANNLPATKTLLAQYLNIRDVLGYDKVVLPLKALDVLTSALG